MGKSASDSGIGNGHGFQQRIDFGNPQTVEIITVAHLKDAAEHPAEIRFAVIESRSGCPGGNLLGIVMLCEIYDRMRKALFDAVACC